MAEAIVGEVKDTKGAEETKELTESSLEEKDVKETEVTTESKEEVVVGDIKEADETKDEVITESSLLEKKIIRQVEYYFGDVNLPKDKFLKEKQKEEDGWVSLECLTTFNRLKELSTDLQEICNALSKSKTGIIELNKEDLKVRRSKEMPLPDLDDPLVVKKKKMKTLYMKGFPETHTLDDVTDFLLELDVQSVFVKLRKDDDYKFKGSIFVELQTQEQADKLVNDKEIKCGEETLLIMKREDYFNKKSSDRKGSNKNGNQNDGPQLEKKDGVVIHFKGMSEGSKREDLKDVFGSVEKIAWVDFNMGETQGFIRFDEEGGAQKAIDAVKAKNEDKIIVNEAELEVRILEGEEADNYWKMAEEEMIKRKSQKNSRGGGRGRGRGRGGRGGRGGHYGNRSGGNKNFKRKREWDDGPRNKEQSTEAKKTKAEE